MQLVRSALKRVPGLRPGVQLARRWRDAAWPGALILAYHRVAELERDPHEISVTPRQFAEHLEVLRRETHPMHLSDLIAALRRGRVPRRAVALTFDDGYADNLLAAKPLLERYGVPATFFVASGCLGAAREFWWDELVRLLLEPTTLPPFLSLDVGRTRHEWEIIDADNPAATLCEPPKTPRDRVFGAVQELMRAVADDEQQRILADLRAWSGAAAETRAAFRTLSVPELQELSDSRLVDVGAHTITHPVLAGLSPEQQHAEIAGSKAALEGWLGRPVTSFAYPYGDAHFFDATSVATARAAGFACACVVDDRVLRHALDPFLLSRVMVCGTRVGDDFPRWLRERR